MRVRNCRSLAGPDLTQPCPATAQASQSYKYPVRCSSAAQIHPLRAIDNERICLFLDRTPVHVFKPQANIRERVHPVAVRLPCSNNGLRFLGH